MAEFDELGREIPDPRPVEWPTGVGRPRSLQEEIQRFVRGELSRAADAAGVESFEESDDFDVEGEDPDILLPTAYELVGEQGDRDASDLSRPVEPAPAPGKPVGEPVVNTPTESGASAPAKTGVNDPSPPAGEGRGGGST